jgi:hypothetical protein
VAVDGVVNLSVESTTITGVGGQLKPESAGTGFISVTRIQNAGVDTLRVTHNYQPSLATVNLYQVDVTIENIGASSVDDVRYRRVMDWDIPPTTFSEYVTIHVGTAANLIRATTDGFDSANPLSISAPNYGNPPTTLVPGDPDMIDNGVTDHGALFDFGFGSLAPTESKTFKIFYGATGTEAAALAALGAVGAEVYSFGQPSHASGDPTHGIPNTFIFAFAGVGGTPVEAPEPATLLLLGSGLLGVALRSRLRRGSGQAALRRRKA